MPRHAVLASPEKRQQARETIRARQTMRRAAVASAKGRMKNKKQGIFLNRLAKVPEQIRGTILQRRGESLLKKMRIDRPFAKKVFAVLHEFGVARKAMREFEGVKIILLGEPASSRYAVVHENYVRVAGKLDEIAREINRMQG